MGVRDTKESSNAYQKQWAAKNRDKVALYRERGKDKRQAYAIAHREENRLRCSAWYQQNKEKARQNRKAWILKNKDRENEIAREGYHRNREQNRVRDIAYNSVPKNRIRKLIYNARVRAEKKNISFDRSIFLVAQQNPPTHCECCGSEFNYALSLGRGNRNVPNAPSIDRIDNDFGYIAGNVAFICCRCNWVKNDATEAELVAVVAYVQRKTQAKEVG